MIRIGFGMTNISVGSGTDLNFKAIMKGIRIAIGTGVSREAAEIGFVLVSESEGERPVNKGDVEQPRAGQPKAEAERPQAEEPKAEAEKPKEQHGKAELEKPKAEEKAKTEKPKEEEK